MSYTPTNWKSGDIVTSEKLNKLENGVAGACGGVVIAHLDGENLDIKPSDIFTGTALTGMAYLEDTDGNLTQMHVAQYADGYYFIVFTDSYLSDDINTVFTQFTPPGG